MIDVRIDSIIYQSQIYYRDLINTLVGEKRLGKAYEDDWRKADEILGYLESLNYRDNLTDEDDITNVNYTLYCLIKLCELNQYPVSAPIEFQEPPTVIVGAKGDKGDIGNTGPQGLTGLATDFSVSLVIVPTEADSFGLTESKGVRWDVVVIKSTTEQRTETILATWNSDASAIEYSSESTPDIVGDTSGLEFSVILSGSNIVLLATPVSGSWSIVGSRYFIPNNGNGSGPISGVLASGSVYIGNINDSAQARTISGVISITNTGVTSFNSEVIVNADINPLAAIGLGKLAPLTASKVSVTDSLGVLSTSSISSATLLFLDISSSLTGLLNLKLTNPTTTIGDIIIRNATNNIARLGIGTAGQVLTVSGGVPIWSTPGTGFANPMTSIGDIIIRNGSNVTARLGIGSSNQILTVNGGIPAWTSPAYTTLTGVTTVASTTYTVLTTDNVIHMDNTGARTVTMFAGASATNGKIYWIKDSAGTASSATITINRAGSDTFEDGSTSITIIGDRSVQGIYWGSSRWNII